MIWAGVGGDSSPLLRGASTDTARLGLGNPLPRRHACLAGTMVLAVGWTFSQGWVWDQGISPPGPHHGCLGFPVAWSGSRPDHGTEDPKTPRRSIISFNDLPCRTTSTIAISSSGLKRREHRPTLSQWELSIMKITLSAAGGREHRVAATSPFPFSCSPSLYFSILTFPPFLSPSFLPSICLFCLLIL